MHTLLLLWVVFLGALLPAQSGINATLRQHLGHPILASISSFSTGLAALGVVALIVRAPLPSWASIAGAPFWAWGGGVIGATLVTTALISAPRLGAALLIGALVAGQLASSVAFDHFGWAGFPVRPVSAMKLVGVGLLALGVLVLHRAH